AGLLLLRRILLEVHRAGVPAERSGKCRGALAGGIIGDVRARPVLWHLMFKTQHFSRFGMHRDAPFLTIQGLEASCVPEPQRAVSLEQGRRSAERKPLEEIPGGYTVAAAPPRHGERDVPENRGVLPLRPEKRVRCETSLIV